MFHRAAVLAVVLSPALIGLGCQSRDVPSVPGGSSPALIQHVDRGCSTGSEGFAAVQEGGAYLSGYSVLGDTLSLDIHFQANCCPEFVENAVFGPGTISIDVGDTFYGCRCICDYDNTFRLLWPEPGRVAIAFASRRYGSETAICSFDTVLVIPD